MGTPAESDAAILRRGQDISIEERKIAYLAPNVLSQVTIDRSQHTAPNSVSVPSRHWTTNILKED